MELSTILKIIRDLTNKTVEKGCSEHEAMAAAQKVGSLLKTYNLSLTEVFVEETSCVTKDIPIKTKNRHPINLCMMALADFCDCKVYFYSGKVRSYKCFGMPSDTELFAYLYSVIKSSMDMETLKFKISDPIYLSTLRGCKTLTVSFQKGMACRIHERLSVMTKQRKNEERQNCSTSTSLVVVKNTKVEDEFKKLEASLKLKKGSSFSINYNESFKKGERAAENIALNRPIETTTTSFMEIKNENH